MEMWHGKRDLYGAVCGTLSCIDSDYLIGRFGLRPMATKRRLFSASSGQF